LRPSWNACYFAALFSNQIAALFSNHNNKLSLFLDKVLQKFASLVQQARLLNKGRYYELIKFLPKPAVDSEVIEKLDL